MPKKNSPGCTCCGTCVIYADTFDRANSSSMGSGWTERVADWSISSNAAACSSGTGLMIATASNPDGNPNGYVASVVNCNTANDQAQVAIGYVDDNNFYFARARFTATDGFLSIGRKNAGVISILAPEVTLSSAQINFDCLLTICYANGTLTAKLVLGTEPDGVSFVSTAATATPTGVIVGLSTGTQTGSIKFKSFDWEFKKSVDRPRCPTCDPPCSFCQDGTWPYAVQVEFNGVTANGCGTCNDFNDTAYIAYPYAAGFSPFGPCTYGATISACTYTAISVRVCASFLLLKKWAVTLVSGGGNAVFNTGAVCSGVTNEFTCDQAFTHTSGSGSVQCNFAPATCTVTPLL